MKVALIGCGKNKRAGCWTVKDLYTSTRFRFALAYALKHHDRAYVLSAKHGLLDLEQRISDYDLALKELSHDERRRWAQKVAGQIIRTIPRDFELDLFCGREYREFLMPLLPAMTVRAPLRGMRIGEQLHWFSRNT